MSASSIVRAAENALKTLREQWPSERRFAPQVDAATRERKRAGWAAAARRLPR